MLLQCCHHNYQLYRKIDINGHIIADIRCYYYNFEVVISVFGISLSINSFWY